MHARVSGLAGPTEDCSRDPLDGVDGTTTVANPYHYADNDPTNKQDPTGMRPSEGCWMLDAPVVCTKKPDHSLSVALKYLLASESRLLIDALEMCSSGGEACIGAITANAVRFGKESRPGGAFDAKVALQPYLTGPDSPHNGKEYVELGDPDYFYYYDVIGNLLWGIMASKYVALSDDQIVNCQNGTSAIPYFCRNTGQHDPGDDIVIRAGLALGHRVKGRLQVVEYPEIRQAIRDLNGQLRGVATPPLDYGGRLHNKLIERRLA